MKKISVFLVDDSALVRQLTADLLSRQPDIEIIGTAADPVAATTKLENLRPDVILLDIEMPKMNGIQYLQQLRRMPSTANTPVVMYSSLTERGCEHTIRALEMGAVDFVTKPKLDMQRGLEALSTEISQKIRAAAASRRPPKSAASSTEPSTQQPHASRPGSASETPVAIPPVASSTQLIAIGCSTGGTEALREIFSSLSGGLPPIVIVQHMPERFTKAFAARLDSIGPVRVKEVEDGDKLVAGHAYLAPGNFHLEVQKIAGFLRARVFTAPPVNGHRPSVDVMFQSCIRASGANTMAALLTGMGQDGARGLLSLFHCGAVTIAQNEASSIVFGMPREAIQLGAAQHVLALNSIAAYLNAHSGSAASAAAAHAHHGVEPAPVG